MFIFRGERLKEPGYFMSQQDANKEELKKKEIYYKREIERDRGFWSDAYVSLLKSVRKAYEENFTIALDRNQINAENIDTIIHHIEKEKSRNFRVKVCIDNVDGQIARKNSEGVDYVFTTEEMSLLIRLDTYLKNNGYDRLSIIELARVDDLEDLKESWTLDQVIKANNTIDEIAKYITDNELSPFEAMLFIHKWASTFIYNRAGKGQIGRVLPSVLNTNKIVCSGYASLVKALIDKINLPGLTCDIASGYFIEDDGSHTAHCHNLVTIEDPKYEIKGTYVEDACNDSRLEGEKYPRGFANCLYSVKDLMNFNDGKYFSIFSEYRYFSLLDPPEGTKNHFDNLRRSTGLKKIFSNIQVALDRPEAAKIFGKDSMPIPQEKYEQALRVIYSAKHDKEDVEKLIKRDVESSRARAVKMFDERSKNIFSRGLSKSQRKAIISNSKEQNTRRY